jgi:uncharacterized NAD(P)/FAD-binding protein YdhS
MATADILIIGGGLSGAMLAAQLLKQPGARRLLVVEPRAELGRGEAYSATELGHTLNGNAARMSVDPDNSDDLTQWLTAHIEAGGWPESAEQGVPIAELFPPRGLFGVYARQRLAEAQLIGARYGSQLVHLQDEAVDVQVTEYGVRVKLAKGPECIARQVVLATGMFAAARTPQMDRAPGAALTFDPWDVAALKRLDPQARVLIVGSGLTMVDAVASLDQAGHRGPIEVFSRHGLLPQVRRQPPAWRDFLTEQPHLITPLQVMGELRRQCKQAMAEGVDWQAPLDTVRVHIARLWSQASERHQRQFVRHVRPWWESHHHRSPPQGGALLAQRLEEGRLHIHAATLQRIESDGQTVSLVLKRRGEGGESRVTGQALINSTGIVYDWRKVDRPLPRQLLARGLVQPGPLALGIAAQPDGAVLDTTGTPSPRLFAMGPPLRGLWWESTAVTDVALQSKALALRLVRG